MIKINEIFYSIQGESSSAGYPTLFIRTTGCPLRCSYCDTKYSYFDGVDRSVDDLLSTAATYSGLKYVCVTGGEPLVQPEVLTLLTGLCDQGYSVSLETSGAKDGRAVDPRVRQIIDVKTPGSNESKHFHVGNLELATPNNEFKFVICNESDFSWSIEFCKSNELPEKTQVLFSPSHQEITLKWLAEALLNANINARLQAQMHKVIWPEQTRGV